MPSNEDAVQSWIADGTPTEEPVTIETPVEEAPVIETPLSTEAEAPAPASELPEPTPEPEVEYFIGRLNGEEYKIPAAFELPTKRGEEVEWVPITESQKRQMMQKDYSIKTAEVAAQRRDFERERREFAASQARFEAQRQALEAERKELAEIRQDSEKYQAFLEHLDLMKTNPAYRKTAEDAVRGREDRAELNALREQEAQAAAQDAAAMAQGWIEEVAKTYPNVDPDRVRGLYADALVSGRLTDLDRKDVEKLFEHEAQTFQQMLAKSPLMSELEEMKAQLAQLQKTREAETRNAQTNHALNRSKAPNLAPVGAPAAPPAATPKRERFGPNELVDKISEWVKT